MLNTLLIIVFINPKNRDKKKTYTDDYCSLVLVATNLLLSSFVYFKASELSIFINI